MCLFSCNNSVLHNPRSPLTLIKITPTIRTKSSDAGADGGDRRRKKKRSVSHDRERDRGRGGGGDRVRDRGLSERGGDRHRSRLCAMEFKRKTIASIFAATPPLESLGAILSLTAAAIDGSLEHDYRRDSPARAQIRAATKPHLADSGRRKSCFSMACSRAEE